MIISDKVLDVTYSGYYKTTNNVVRCELYNSKGKLVFTNYAIVNNQGYIKDFGFDEFTNELYLLKIKGTNFTKFLTLCKNCKNKVKVF